MTFPSTSVSLLGMSWKNEIDELGQRRAMAEKMGGEEKVARQHSRGKMDARARLAGIVDPGSFREIGKIAGRGQYSADGALEGLRFPSLLSEEQQRLHELAEAGIAHALEQFRDYERDMFTHARGRVAKMVEIGTARVRNGMVVGIRRRGQGRRVSGRGWASHRRGAW